MTASTMALRSASAHSTASGCSGACSGADSCVCPSVSRAACTWLGSMLDLGVFLFNCGERFVLSQHFVEVPVPLQSNVAESVLLRQCQGLAPHQFQNCEKHADHGAPAALTVEEFGDRDGIGFARIAKDLFKIPDHVGDADGFFSDLVYRTVLSAIQHRLKCLHQVEECDCEPGIVIL